MVAKINNNIKTINDSKTTQTKLISSINGQNNQLNLVTVKIDNIQTKMKSYDSLFSDLNDKIDAFSAKRRLLSTM